MSDTSLASAEVLDINMLPGHGRFQGLALVEVTLDGVAIILQGARILRRADGLSYVEPPCYRHTDGDLVPAAVLPTELEEAVARAVLERGSGPNATCELSTRTCWRQIKLSCAITQYHERRGQALQRRKAERFVTAQSSRHLRAGVCSCF